MPLPVKIVSCFGGTGVLECWKKLKPEFLLEYVLIITPLLHHSTTPAAFRMKERPLKPPVGAVQSQVLRAWILYLTP
jgi:hypothetical protein